MYLKVPKVESTRVITVYRMFHCTHFQIYKYILKIADLQAHNCTAMHCELIDRLFSNSHGLDKAKVTNECFVIVIKIYKVINK